MQNRIGRGWLENGGEVWYGVGVMLCEKCKENEATVHMTQFLDGRIRSVHLCEACASAMGVDVQGGTLDMGRLLADMRRQVEEAAGEGRGRRNEPLSAPPLPRTCPQCGMRREEIRRAGNPGCPRCYETFGALLMPGPDELGTYRGWRPKEFPEDGTPAAADDRPSGAGNPAAEPERAPGNRPPAARIRECRRSLESKQRRLHEAVEAERYEKAAQLRDEIQALKRELESLGAEPDGDGEGDADA